MRTRTEQPSGGSPELVGLSGNSWDAIRIRLELASVDAATGRLDGVVGHYKALRRLVPSSERATLWDSLRALGRLLDDAKQRRLGALAHETALALERYLADAGGQPPIYERTNEPIDTPDAAHGSASVVGPASP